MSPSARIRCGWAGTDPLYVKYHDEELGVPLHDERRLFEFLILEGAQAGLSWITILRKREGYRIVKDGSIKCYLVHPRRNFYAAIKFGKRLP
jgi:hypothetical protein